MKKSVHVFALVLFVAALVPRPAAAQVSFNIGVRGGVSSSNVSWSDDNGQEKAVVRPTFGVFGAFNLSPAFAVQAELNYVTMGEWWTDMIGTDEWKTVENFSYLQIPVLLKGRLAGQGKIAPFLLAGPAVGILLSAHEKYYLNGALDEDFNAKSFYKSIDFGALFGGGAEFAVSKLKVFIDIRYTLGLINAFDSTKFTMKTRALALTGGVIF